MAFNLDSIKKGVANRPPRIILTGTEKIGKSTFASKFSNPVFIPIKGEEGVDDLDIAKFNPVTTYDELMEAFETLYNEKHDYETVVIDSISTLEPLVWDVICKESGVASIEKVGGGFGKGYIEAAEKWRKIMQALDSLRNNGMASILIGHVVVKTFVDPTTESYDCYQLDLNKHAVSSLLRWADCILFANIKTIVKRQNEGFNKTSKKAIVQEERVLFTKKRPSHPGGGRGVYGQIPYELPLDYEVFSEAIKTATKERK